MAFNPENPDSPMDLYATFAIDGHLTGLIYASDENTYSRIRANWEPLDRTNDPVGQGANIVFVDPSFIAEFDARMAYGEFLSQEDVAKDFGIKPNFGSPAQTEE